MNDVRYRRMLARRGLHRSRSVAVSIALVIVALAGLAVAALGLLPLAGVRLPVSLADLPRAVVESPAVAWTVVAALAVLGLVALVAGIAPGRRARHRLADERTVVLVDDDVLAGAVSGRVARSAGIAGDQVRTELSARRLRTRVRPTSGHPLRVGDVEAVARDTVSALAPAGRLRVAAAVEPVGVVGA